MSDFGRRRVQSAPALVLLLLLLSACSRDRLDQLISQLDSSSHREQAIEGLLQFVRQAPRAEQARIKDRVVNALIVAYNEDENRSEIVAALATLAEPKAEQVFVAALKDAHRGGSYYEAAVQSARLIGDLKLKEDIPALVEVLSIDRGPRRSDHTSWLERAIIQSLDRLGDKRAVDVLIKVLKTDPLQQDFYLNRMAATALGHLGDPRAIKPLVASLTTTSHGLLLFEESRRALCRLGSQAAKELLNTAGQRDRRHQVEAHAVTAARVLGDIGDYQTSIALAALLKPKDPDDFRLAIAESLLRLGNQAGEKIVRDLIDSESVALSYRRQAAELWGWSGTAQGAEAILSKACKKNNVPQNVFCWSTALAYARIAGPEGVSRMDALAANKSDTPTRRYLLTYRQRLLAVAHCAVDQSCYERILTAGGTNWRQQERAALELGRLQRRADSAGSGPLMLLAGVYAKGHPQLKQAILVTLEQLLLDPKKHQIPVSKLASLLQEPPPQKEEDLESTPPALVSRALCLGERLKQPTRNGP